MLQILIFTAHIFTAHSNQVLQDLKAHITNQQSILSTLTASHNTLQQVMQEKNIIDEEKKRLNLKRKEERERNNIELDLLRWKLKTEQTTSASLRQERDLSIRSLRTIVENPPELIQHFQQNFQTYTQFTNITGLQTYLTNNYDRIFLADLVFTARGPRTQEDFGHIMGITTNVRTQPRVSEIENQSGQPGIVNTVRHYFITTPPQMLKNDTSLTDQIATDLIKQHKINQQINQLTQDLVQLGIQ